MEPDTHQPTHELHIPDTSVLHAALNGVACRPLWESGTHYLNGPEAKWIMVVVDGSVVAVPEHWAVPIAA